MQFCDRRRNGNGLHEPSCVIARVIGFSPAFLRAIASVALTAAPAGTTVLVRKA